MRTLTAFPLENRQGVASKERVKLLLQVAVNQITIIDFHRGLQITASMSQMAVILKILYRVDVMWYISDEDLVAEFFADFF